ncbi:MAG: metallophosphoesterase, partial [archaeon]|nr:metallophosphoesterase [archaeon]
DNKNYSKNINIEVYDTETGEWDELVGFNVFRNCCWLTDNLILSQGGFDLTKDVTPKHEIITIALDKLFAVNVNLKKKYDQLKAKLKEIEKQKELEKIRIKKEEELKIEMEKKAKKKKRTPNVSPKPYTGMSNSNVNRMSSHRIHLNNLEIEEKSKNQKFLPMSNLIEEKPLIQKFSEISLVTKDNKGEKILIKEVEFDQKGSPKEPSKEKTKLIYDLFIDYLLRPQEWLNKKIETDQKFHFSISEIEDLTLQCIEVLKKQPNLIRINTPVKVFGDIHGQYIDLMNFFYKWGMPSSDKGGDIMLNDYLFLGDYVDRGRFSLETICLLMALKIKYPDQLHLLRGNHEDILINCGFGFEEECEIRLEDDKNDEEYLFELINQMFEYLPLAALIDGKILCLHGGIGANVRELSDIENIQRPFEVVHEAETKEQKIVMDILWSDPTDNDNESGIQPNLQRDSNNLGVIVKYGPDIVQSFLKSNGLSHIIRAHECVDDGFERFAKGMLITVFSATDYCGSHKNAGAMIIINQNKAIIPHLIYPPEGGNNYWINDENYLKLRPPTPPRVRYNKNNY